MIATVVVFDAPHRIATRPLALVEPGPADIVVDVEWTGVSAGTERLLWSGDMPPFPGLAYPLVPGYETVGRVRSAGEASGRHEGERVFVGGARCFTEAHCLFGGTASRLVVPGARAVPVAASLGDTAALLALAATAHSAIRQGALPDLVVGHGVLGRLLARLTTALGGPAPTVWESNPARHGGALGYAVTRGEDDPKHGYRSVYDASGAPDLLDTLVRRLAPGGEIVLAGFYSKPLSFDFPPAFIRRARFRVAAEWAPEDLAAVAAMANDGRLALDGLVTDRRPAGQAPAAYDAAFRDPSCVKMLLDWGTPA